MCQVWPKLKNWFVQVQMESEGTFLASMRVQVVLSRAFLMPRGLEIILHHHLQYSALKTPAHFASGPYSSVKTDWPYSKGKASTARTSTSSVTESLNHRKTCRSTNKKTDLVTCSVRDVLAAVLLSVLPKIDFLPADQQ